MAKGPDHTDNVTKLDKPVLRLKTPAKRSAAAPSKTRSDHKKPRQAKLGLTVKSRAETTLIRPTRLAPRRAVEAALQRIKTANLTKPKMPPPRPSPPRP